MRNDFTFHDTGFLFLLKNHEARRTYNNITAVHYPSWTQTSVNKVCAQSNAHTVSDWKKMRIACSNPDWEFDKLHEPHASIGCQTSRFPIEGALQI